MERRRTGYDLISAVIMLISITLMTACGGGIGPDSTSSQASSVANPLGKHPATIASVEVAGDLKRRSRLGIVLATPNPAADQLLNWAEINYPQYFPSHSTTLTEGPWVYRSYMQTGILLGINAGDVYVTGGEFGGQLIKVGRVSDFVKPTPTITLNATANLNGTTDLEWKSSDAISCNFEGSVSQSVLANGSLTVLPSSTSDQRYLLACVGDGGKSSVVAEPRQPTSFGQTCENWTGNWIGEFFALNNYDPKAVTHKQCMSASAGVDGTITAHLDWAFDHTWSGVKADPVLFFGKVNPNINLTQSTVSGFPVAVGKMSPTLGVAYTNTITNVSAGSSHDLLIDLYFGKDEDLKVQTLELSILQICVNSCGGPVLDTVTIGGVRYNVNRNVVTDNPTYQGQLAFIRVGGDRTTATVLFKPFIDYAVAHGYLSKNHFFGNFTIQNEVYGGSAVSTIVARALK